MGERTTPMGRRSWPANCSAAQATTVIAVRQGRTRTTYLDAGLTMIDVDMFIAIRTSTHTRCPFDVAAHDQGARTTCLSPEGTQIGREESIPDTARVLGRMFDGIEFPGLPTWAAGGQEGGSVIAVAGLGGLFHRRPGIMLAGMWGGR